MSDQHRPAAPEGVSHEALHALEIPHEHGHDHEHDPEHSHEHGHEHSHEHGSAPHRHVHSPEHIKQVSNRLARAIGHLESVKKMVEDGRDCSEVLIQLAAVRSALNSTSKVILKDHLEHCIVEAVEQNDMASIEELNRAIEQFMR